MQQPRILKIQPGNEDSAAQEAADSLKRGFLVIIPTDTVYGVAAMPGSIDKIYEAKARERGKPIPILAGCIEDVEKFGALFGIEERRLANALWPGPLTLVLRVGTTTEGFRVPDNTVALATIRKSGGILRVTSANVSGQPPALTAEDAAKSLGGFVDTVLDAGRTDGGVPSTVAQVVNGKVNIIREGAISLNILEQVCRNA